MNQDFNRGDSEENPGFEAFQSSVKTRVAKLVTIMLRQSLGIYTLQLMKKNYLGNRKLAQIIKLWNLTEYGSEVDSRKTKPVQIPDPNTTFEFFTW